MNICLKQKIIKIILLFIAINIIYTACNNANHSYVPLKLGDTKPIMIKKMQEIGATDVTNKTRFQLIEALAGQQEYFWWELKDKTIVGINLAGNQTLEVVTIEIGEPGKGIKGIENWRSQNLKCITSIDRTR